MEEFTAEVRTVDGAIVPPNVRPVVMLAGNDFDMGRQHVQQLVRIYGADMFARYQRSFTDEDHAELRAIEEIVRGFASEYLEQFRGMAEGAATLKIDVSYDQFLAKYVALGTPKSFPPADEPDGTPTRGCSGFAAWGTRTRDGKLIASSSWDSDPTPVEYVVVAYPESGHAFLCNAYVGDEFGGVAWFPGMNNKGLTYIHHGSGQAGDEPITPATIGQSLYIGHTLRFASTTEEALEQQLSYPEGAGVYAPFGTNTGGLWADTHGGAFDIESRNPQLVRRAGQNGEDDFIYATNNSIAPERTPTDSILPVTAHGWDLTFVPHGGWEGMNEDAVKRNLFIYNMLHNYVGEIDVAFVEMMWRFTGRSPAFSTYAEAVEKFYSNRGEGWDSKIAALDNATVNILQPSDGDDGLYFLSNGPLTRHSHEIPDFSFWIPDGLNAGYSIRLAADVSSVLEHARGAAMTELTLANRALRQLTVTDTAFSRLTERFDEAAASWYVACHHMSNASRSQGDEALNHSSAALRRFARVQAYARHVRESIVQPASTPEELGLSEYWGAWGQWDSWRGSH